MLQASMLCATSLCHSLAPADFAFVGEVKVKRTHPSTFVAAARSMESS